jgi:hypothetical protein
MGHAAGAWLSARCARGGAVALIGKAGGNRLPVIGQLDPWSDGTLGNEDLPQLSTELELLEAAANNGPQRELVAALRLLLE